MKHPRRHAHLELGRWLVLLFLLRTRRNFNSANQQQQRHPHRHDKQLILGAPRLPHTRRRTIIDLPSDFDRNAEIVMSCDVTESKWVVPTEEPAIEPLRLRQAAVADAGALALVGAATFLEAFTWMLPGADIIAHCAKNHTAEAYRAALAQPHTRITLAETVPSGAPVGYAMLAAPDLPSFDLHPGDIELKRIYLLSRFRSRRSAPVCDAAGQPIAGVSAGQALMNAAIADAQSLGCRRLLLGTNADNQRAIGFYRRNNFADAGTRTFQVGSQCCCDLIMARPL
jgi:ribosomal protein S18 acetylase RimI-like enzyme